MTGRVIPDMMMIEGEEMTAKDQELSIVKDMHLTQILNHVIIGIAGQHLDTTEIEIVTEIDDKGDEATVAIGKSMRLISQMKKNIETTNTKGVKDIVLILGEEMIAHDHQKEGEVIDHQDEAKTHSLQNSNQKKKLSR